MRLSFTARTEKAPGVWECTFQPENQVEYVPGQYARFTFPFVIADPRGKQHRTFTLISHPSEQTIRFITRLDPPLSVYKQHLQLLKLGDTMFIDEPHGDAVLPRLASTPLVFVIQGVGIASLFSMLAECDRSDLAHPITLLWARRGEEDGLLTGIPGENRITTRHDVVAPDRLTVAVIFPYIKSHSLIYLSGSQPFVEDIGAQLEAHGIPRARLIYDYFSGYLNL